MSQVELLAELVNVEQTDHKTVGENDNARFLRFSLSKENSGLVSLDRLIEVMKIRPQEILPIPDLPAHWLGIANRRGNAVWMIDLLYLMGATHLSQRQPMPEFCRAMVVQAQEQAIGLLVEQVKTIEIYNLNNLQPFSAQTVPSKLRKFLEGYFLDAEGNTLALLNVDTIIETVDNLD